MEMEQVLLRSLQRIRSGALQNEAQVKQAVILPILRALDWDDSDPSEFVPEYPVSYDDGGYGQVDYALIGKRGPLVFVEAKKLDHANDSGVDQVFKYAANRGVPFLILTDGNVWDFYLSMADGIPAERRFYHMELQREDKITDHERFLEKFLHKDCIVSNTMEITSAAGQLRDGGIQREEARNAIPIVWRKMLETPDESLSSLIADAVQGECGTQPELDDVEEFLGQILRSSGLIYQPSADTGSQSTTQPPTTAPSTTQKHTTKIVGFVLDNKPVETGIGNRTLAELVKEFQRRDSTFMERFSALTSGRTRRLVSMTRDGLYDAVHLRDYSLDLENGWWLGTNIGSGPIRKHIATACDIMGVQFGSELTLIER